MRFNSQKGVGTVELLICGPALVALLFVAYEINQRLENASFSTITGRNTLFTHSDHIEHQQASRTALAEQLLPSDKSKKGSLFAPEQNETGRQLLHKPVRGASFLKMESQSNQTIDEIFPTMRAGADITIENVGYRKFLSKISLGEAKVVDGAYALVTPVRSAMEVAFGLKLNDRTRSGVVEYQFDYKNHSLIRSIGLLSSAVGKDREEIDPGFSAYSKGYVEELNGYHLKNTLHPALVGFAVGFIFKDHWTSDSYSTTSGHFQTRCMSRLTMEDSCEKSSELGQRQFVKEVARIGRAKEAFSIFLEGLDIPTFGASLLVDIAITKAVNKIVNTIADKALEEVTKSIYDGVKAELEKEVKKRFSVDEVMKGTGLKNKLTEFESEYGQQINQ